MSEDVLLVKADEDLQELMRSVDDYISTHEQILPIRSLSHLNRARIKLINAEEFISSTLKNSSVEENANEHRAI